MNQQPSQVKDILFWSPKCPYCRNLIEKIQHTPLWNNLVAFDVHDKRFPLPHFVKSVPTIFLKSKREVLVNESLNQWVALQLNYLTQQQAQSGQIPGGAPSAPTHSPQQQQQQQQNPNMNTYQNMYQNQTALKPLNSGNDDLTGQSSSYGRGGISDFNPDEMSARFSDTYSFLDRPDAVASHNMAFIGKTEDVPTITKVNDASGDYPGNASSSPSLEYNPNDLGVNRGNNNLPNNMGGNMGNMPGGNMGGNMGNMTGGMSGNIGSMNYDPNPFGGGQQTQFSSEKQKELDSKYEELLNNRNLEDSLSDLRY